jgi:hypothetical protein
MSDHAREQTTKHPPSRSVLRVTLPAFAVLVLRQRARDKRLSVSVVVEELILANIMTDELQAMTRQSPDFARMAEEWFRSAITRRR